MFSAVRGILSKLVSPLWSTAQVDADGGSRSPDSETIRQLCDGVVTQLSLDYGLIDDAIYFTSGVVLGGVPLKVGDMVNCIAVGDGAQGGWKALRVMKSCDAWEGRGGISVEDECAQLRPLIGRVTSYDGKGGQINNTTYFSCSSLWEGYEPMKGDWVQATYLIDPNQWTTQAQSVAPLRFCRLNQVRVTSIYEKEGVVGDSVFFCLDSLMLPAHYRPLPGHVVNLVMLESSQSRYHWRALCMAPCTEGLVPSPIHMPMAALETLMENKEGLDVTCYGQFGDLMVGESRELVLWIQNKGSKTHHLKFCNFAGWDSEEQFFLKTLERELKEPASDSCPVPVEERGSHAGATGGKETQHSLGVRREERGADIPPGERLCVVVGCQAKSLGSCAELLLLHFSSFDIGRRLEVTVCCNDERLLLPHVPYSQVDTKPVRVAPSHVITITAPQDTLRLPNRHLPSFLPSYTVPQALRDCVAGQKDILVIQPCLGEVLSASNAQARFSTLLWMEEIHAENELGGFTIQGVLLRKGVVYLHLEILGLAEGRPYLTIGDRILLKSPQSDGGVMEYVSYVVEINDEDVSLRVNSDFHHSYLGEPLDVEFCYNRTTMKRCHHAVEQIKSFVETVFFPNKVAAQTPQLTVKWLDEDDQNKALDENELAPAKENGLSPNISVNSKSEATQTKDSNVPLKPTPRLGHFFNRDLNPAQKEAVKRILAGECRPTPYVLFGPPGTGKTITLIEVILQVYHFVPSARILVCTPSNSAADLICLRLHNSGLMHTASMARVNASYRQDKNIPDVLRPYSKAGEDLSFASFHRIVVSTCSSAGLFYNLGLRVGHFTHVFLDEAGQATEPESMIPISLISEIDGQIVLAGDPCQLGPIVKSKIASTFGLGLSLMERLMANPLYARHQWGYNPKLVTKLIYNYRSHEALLSLPSKLFYHGELCVRAPKDVVDSLCQWKTLPKKGFPLLFHGIRGKEMREGNNPSWFNPAEAVQVMLYCCQLTKKLYNPVDASQIGIISPYRKQSEKIRILLGKVGLSDIKVGSVEEFQGQEFLVIILSTVRSNELASSDDLQSALGFLANPKRFNVAITRSRALLLIIGNPHLLIRDTCFRALLNYCFTNGGYLGCDPPPAIRDSQIAASIDNAE
ncbi:RNA helicase Mov10l1 isoform X1 [Corythoichthys intestinalis]|uniref:RNA helicase Mov10l1 isoform X1 n=2 Tax=Corythoichthys intestinalis TaxID=161448 RepID=UPI0025A5D764|nr:RNA helicase Mov10l1 isoform X1 [Corythoichthys intestinalis]XP_057692782.1 RNA helicase Mov10l1 isoform X1 [Corythoichthys intestinalis]XP_057692784.1 RNA helicase Mov10l1 isoform X1 [Corythoichthys intestinalis]XP_057692785.1 RNA helicase Mov10l1 isoform X1 [Corythoichthys intestinalis]XP_057692786.1 RNA helicase Mov10l1 isoform X1 [Corythoichthys intestinalis]